MCSVLPQFKIHFPELNLKFHSATHRTSSVLENLHQYYLHYWLCILLVSMVITMVLFLYTVEANVPKKNCKFSHIPCEFSWITTLLRFESIASDFSYIFIKLLKFSFLRSEFPSEFLKFLQNREFSLKLLACCLFLQVGISEGTAWYYK